jgi:uncharacterized protein (DUF2236 family)
MLWTVAVLAQSALYFYELLVAPLSDAERDAFWEDYTRFGELFGMPREVAPTSWGEFSSWWDGQLAGPDLHLTSEARHIGRALAFEIPLPLIAQPGKRLHALLMLGSLPPRVRELYGLSYGPVEQVAWRGLVAAMRAARPLAPGALVRGRNTQSFALVANTERRRIEHGRPTPQV